MLATMHSDVRGWLRPDWTLPFDGQPRCLRYEGEPGPPAPAPAPPPQDYFQHETLTITLKGLCISRVKDVFDRTFEEHHYLKGILPMVRYAVVGRTQDGRLVTIDIFRPMPGLQCKPGSTKDTNE